MRVLFDIQDRMEDELVSICQKSEMTSTDLDNTYKIVDIIKDITTIDAMHKSEKSKSWDNDYTYDRGHYRRNDNEDLIDHLKEKMRSAHSEEERESYRKTIDQLSR